MLRGARMLPGRQRPAGLITWACAFLDRPQRLAYELEQPNERHQVANCTFDGTDYHSGEELRFRFKVALRGTPLPYGGLRWWFVCPSSGGNIGKLYMPIGGRQFASREAWRLAYPSQRETTAARITRRAIKLRRKLDPEADCALGDTPEKPKWMRWPTYNRIADQIDVAEEHANEDLMRAAKRFMGYAHR